MLKRRDALSPQQRKAAGLQLFRQLKIILQQKQLKTIHCFLPMGSEPDIEPFIDFVLKQELEVICPETLPSRQLKHLRLKSLTQLESGRWGTHHPIGGEQYTGAYDLILVPGLAFDRQGNRLGYGGGYYDSFLKDHPEAHKVGISYPFQLLDHIPTEEHDVNLDEILTGSFS